MTIDQDDQPRTADGRFAVKHGTPPEDAAVFRSDPLIESEYTDPPWTDEQIAAVNEPYDYLRPPYPRTPEQVIDFWMKVKIPDQEVFKARAMAPDHVHPSFAEVGLRCAMAYRDSWQLEYRQMNEAAQKIRSHLVELPSKKWADVDYVTHQALEFDSIVEFGLDDALIRHQAAETPLYEPGVATVQIDPRQVEWLAQETAYENALWNGNPTALGISGRRRADAEKAERAARKAARRGE